MEIGGDMLEEIVCRLALVDLVWANRVSSAWRSAISTSLKRLNTLKPWLVIHSQYSTNSATARAVAYDPRSHLWMEIRKPPPPAGYFSPLRSSHSSLLYMISSSRFAYSVDPLHLHWHEAPTPRMGGWQWRPDPVVAAVGKHLVIVAGGCGSCLIDDHTVPPVQIYDTTTATWECPCDSMPTQLMDSGASTWLSVAVAVAAEEHTMYVSVKSSGVTFSFDPRSRSWSGGYDVRRRGGGGGESVFYSEIAWCSGSGVIAVGLTGEAESVSSVVMWEVEGEGACSWRMPAELLEKLKGDSAGYMPSISVNVMDDFVFIHNPLQPREVIVCHLRLRTCRWGSVCVGVAAFDDACLFRSLVFAASTVNLPHLELAFKLGTTLKTL